VGPRAGLETCEYLASTGIQSQDRPVRSQSLYRLSYPSHRNLYCSPLQSSVLEIFMAVRFVQSLEPESDL
jgi:hypothetical protein